MLPQGKSSYVDIFLKYQIERQNQRSIIYTRSKDRCISSIVCWII